MSPSLCQTSSFGTCFSALPPLSARGDTVCSGAGASAWNWGESDAGQGSEEPCPDWMIIQGIFQGLQ